MQPMAAEDVAAALADVAVGAPLNATVEVAGPEALPIAEFVGRYLAASGDKRKVIADPHATYYGGGDGQPRDRAGGESAPPLDAVRGLVQAWRGSEVSLARTYRRVAIDDKGRDG